MPHDLDTRQRDFAARFDAFLGLRREAGADVDARVAGILARIRREGDAALLALTAELDDHAPAAGELRVTEAELAAARERCPAETLQALDLAKARIEAFHRLQLPTDLDHTDALGVRLGHRWTPVDAVGLYVPGGTAAYPSSVLMNAVPAKVAGVDRVVMTVPAPKGYLNPLVLAAAHIAGVDAVYRVGGAQAVGALAYGTASIAPVDKIVGPGNAYVASAKRQVFGRVGIDSVAGPSEVLIVADSDNDPAILAADLLAQCEHDAAAQAILITDDDALADAVAEAVEMHLANLPRATIAGASWRDFGAILRVARLDEAPALVDRVAPEHLELAVADPEALLARVRHAGAVFLGGQTPEVIGDYVGGPNHVLPTDRCARYASGLSVLDFMKRSTVLGCTESSLQALGPAAVALARAEGLDAHALSVTLRLKAAGTAPA